MYARGVPMGAGGVRERHPLKQGLKRLLVGSRDEQAEWFGKDIH